MAFPTTLESPKNTWLPTERPTGHAAHHNLMATLLMAIQARIGITGSADTASLDYKAANAEYRVNKDASGGYAGLSGFSIRVKSGGGGSLTGFLNSIATTTGKAWSLPDASGTIALESYAITTPDFYKYYIVRNVCNLITNNSFETDLTTWTPYGAATNTRVTSQFYHGTASMQIVTTGASQGTSYNATGLVVGHKYCFSFYAKGNVGGENIEIYAGTANGENSNWVLTTGWTRCYLGFTATATSAVLYPRDMSGVAKTFFIDAVQLEQGSLYPTAFTSTLGQLNLALKNYEGNDPTALKPVKLLYNGSVVTITGPLSGGVHVYNTGICNLTSVDLVGKIHQLHVYIGKKTSSGVWYIGLARRPDFLFKEDITGTGTDQNSATWMDNVDALDAIVNIGNVNASQAVGGAWSIPTQNIVNNYPIYDEFRYLAKKKGSVQQIANYTTSVTMDCFSFDEYDITAQAGALLFNNPTGNPVNGQKLMVRIKDNATSRALTFGSQLVAGAAPLISSTTISKKSWMGFEWDSTDSKWYCIASGTQP